MRQDGSQAAYGLKSIPIKPILTGLAGVVGILFLSRVLTGFVLAFDPYYIYVAAIGIVIAVAISQRMELAVFVYLFAAPLIIGESPGFQGTRSGYQPALLPSEVGLLLIAAVWAATAFFKRKPIMPRCSLYLPFFAFLFVCGLSIASSYVVWDYEIPITERRILNQVSEVVLFALCGVAFWIGASAIQKKEWIRLLFWPVLAAGLYTAAVKISGTEEPVLLLSRGDFLEAYALAFVLARLVFERGGRWNRIGLWAAFLVLLAGTYVNLEWVSGWATASVAAYIVLAHKSKKAVIALALVGFFALFLYPGIYFNVYRQSARQGDMDRFVLWHDSTVMADSVNPVLGIGPSDYMAYAAKYASVWFGDETYDTAHSNWAQMVAETGYLGFAVFLWLISAGIRVGERSVRKVSPDLKWFAVASTASFAAIALTSMIGDYLLPSRTNGGLVSFGSAAVLWLLLGATVSAVRLSPADQESAPAADEILLSEGVR